MATYQIVQLFQAARSRQKLLDTCVASHNQVQTALFWQMGGWVKKPFSVLQTCKNAEFQTQARMKTKRKFVTEIERPVIKLDWDFKGGVHHAGVTCTLTYTFTPHIDQP